MKVSLNVSERISLGSNILPPEGDFTIQRIVRDVKKLIGFSEEELKNLSMKSVSSDSGIVQYSWDITKEKQVEYDFGEKAVEIIAGALEAIGKTPKATSLHFTLWEKFSKA